MWIIERTVPDPEGTHGEAGTNQVVYLTRRRGDAEKGTQRKTEEGQHLRTRRKRRYVGWRQTSFRRSWRRLRVVVTLKQRVRRDPGDAAVPALDVRWREQI